MNPLVSKLPQVETTVFTVMSKLAADHGAINLSQGFPDFEAPPYLIERLAYHAAQGRNQYAPMAGVEALREAIAGKVASLYRTSVDPETEITVTSGATEAIFATVAAVVRPGDEVILFDPAFDCYEPAVLLNGGKPVRIPLAPPRFGIDWDRVRDALTPATRLILINTPHNPTGAAWDREDIDNLRSVVEDTDIWLLGDEVYEHILFDGREHVSLCRYPDLYARSFVISSFGKTYHVTGWKVAYCVAPPPLTRELRRVHQYLTFATSTPTQWAIADFLVAHPEHHENLGAFYQAKRDLFCDLLTESRFRIDRSSGTYFQLLDYRDVAEAHDVELARRLTIEHKVASIPISVLCEVDPRLPVLRFCFAKDDATLARAAEVLCAL